MTITMFELTIYTTNLQTNDKQIYNAKISNIFLFIYNFYDRMNKRTSVCYTYCLYMLPYYILNKTDIFIYVFHLKHFAS